MALWDNLIKRIVDPIIKDEVKKNLDEKVDVKPPVPQESPDDVAKGVYTQALSYNYSPISYQGAVPRNFQTGVKFQTLRDFANFYPILRSCINFRKRQITQLNWDITPKEVAKTVQEKQTHKDEIMLLKKFFKYPTGDKSSGFRDFCNIVLEDLMVLDAAAIYRRKNKKGGLYAYQPIDASTIKLVLYDDGTLPQPPDYAYVQEINGQVVAKLTIEELIYRKMNSRSYTPYGLSPVESLIIVVTTALKLSAYNLSYLTEGNVPEGFVELPKDVASDPDQLKQWQNAWDAMFAGDPRFQRKIKFLPEGMKWTATKKTEDLQFERFEKWLLQETCSIMEVAPQSIGFQFERGKGATEEENEIGKMRGLYPIANFLKEIFDMIIQEEFGYDHLEFVWTDIDPTNMLEEAKVFDILSRSGAISVDEYRIGQGMEPIGCPPYIMTPVGPIFVKDLLKQSEQGVVVTPFRPGSGQDKGTVVPTNPSLPKPGQTAPSTSAPVAKPKKEPENATPPSTSKPPASKINKVEVVEELKRWKKVAINDLKSARGFRDFKTMMIDPRTQDLIKSGLDTAKTKDDLDDLFDPFIGQENQIVSAMLELYDEVNTIAREAPKN